MLRLNISWKEGLSEAELLGKHNADELNMCKLSIVLQLVDNEFNQNFKVRIGFELNVLAGWELYLSVSS